MRFIATPCRLASRGQHGLTLVELLVAMVMAFILLGGVITVFLANKQTYRVQDALARVQENGRFALTLLVRDIRMAGFRGCATRSVVKRAKNTINTSEEGSFFLNFDMALEGFEGPGDSRLSSAAPELAAYFGKLTATTPGAPVAGSDVITVRGIAPCGDRVLEDQRFDNPANFKIGSNSCLRDCDFVLVTNCQDAAIFQTTNVSQESSTKKTTVVHAAPGQNGGTACKLGNTTKDLGADFSGADIYKLRSATYYVGDTQRGVRALYVIENGIFPPLELVEGVENLQVAYGEDTDGDAGADAYTASGSVGTWANVVSARVDLLLQSADANAIEASQQIAFAGATYNEGDDADRRLRQVYGAHVTVRNNVP